MVSSGKLVCLAAVLVAAAGQDTFIITTTDLPSDLPPPDTTPFKELIPTDIYSFHVKSHIKYRYSTTNVTSRVANRDSEKPQEIGFSLILPETAFISRFAMNMDGKDYVAYVKKKEEAKKDYNEAVNLGQSAGIIEKDLRNSNAFTVSVNVRASGKVTFNLTYEELLNRRVGRYEQVINFSPNTAATVNDFLVEVLIEESQNLTKLHVPDLQEETTAIQTGTPANKKEVEIERPSGKVARIKWKPTAKEQAELASKKLSGQFVVQYDVDREQNAGEILVMNGYFVHFFAPAYLKPLKKHVVFVLDISGSMWGRKLEQLKGAMKQILGDLKEEDYFNILTFSSEVYTWSLDEKSDPEPWIMNRGMKKEPQPFPATKDNVKKAQSFIDSLSAAGGTNIHDSVVQAINLTSSIKAEKDHPKNGTNGTEITRKRLPTGTESMIIFLTDGEPTVGITELVEIQRLVHKSNENNSIPLFSLAFGEGADFPFVKKLSLQNGGFARKIYEAADAELQLRGFYNEIASPLLSNVTFNYTSAGYEVTNVTTTKFPTVFGGTEIAIAGLLVPLRPLVIPESEDETVTTTERDAFPIDTSQFANATTTNSTNEELSKEPNSPVVLTSIDKYIVDVAIGGNGRDGPVLFKDPDFFTHNSWGIFGPDVPSPTPTPTPEDRFLERLYAYLTIRQLLDKDLAELEKENLVDEDEGSVSTTPKAALNTTTITCGANGDVNGTTNGTSPCTPVKETPKEEALRLALKYGFVTSLTSLVVVKPNATSVADTVSTDEKQVEADSLMSALNAKYVQQPIVPRKGVRPTRLPPNYSSSHSWRQSSKHNMSYRMPIRLALPPLIPDEDISGGGGSGGFQPLSANANRYRPHSAHLSKLTNRIASQGGNIGLASVLSTAGRPVSLPINHGIYHHTSSPHSKIVGFQSNSGNFAPYAPLPISPINHFSTNLDYEMIENLEEVEALTTNVPITLARISWLVKSKGGYEPLDINGTLSTIAEKNEGLNADVGYECGYGELLGGCKHLKDCIIPEIIGSENDKNANDEAKAKYFFTYACSLTSMVEASKQFYAGICCPAGI